MSSVKRLKKEINCLTEQFASDGFGLIAYQPEKREEVIALITDAITLRNEQIHRLNHLKEAATAEGRPSDVAAAVRKAFFGRMHELFLELSDLSAGKGKKGKSGGKSIPKSDKVQEKEG